MECFKCAQYNWSKLHDFIVSRGNHYHKIWIDKKHCPACPSELPYHKFSCYYQKGILS